MKCIVIKPEINKAGWKLNRLVKSLEQLADETARHYIDEAVNWLKSLKFMTWMVVIQMKFIFHTTL